MNHPWYHPHEWDDIEQGRREPRPGVRYYIFLDLETCGDKNYPYYLNRTANIDQIGKRGRRGTLDHAVAIQTALRSKIMQQNPGSKLVIFDCLGHIRSDRVESLFWTRENNQDERLVLASMSATPKDQMPGDMGLPPGPCLKCNLTNAELTAIDTCTDDRPYLLTFAGNFRADIRKQLKELHNGKDVLIGTAQEIQQYMGSSNEKDGFRKMALQSQFAAVPRGDNLFSYRFAEVTGCGAIPVVYADDWVFPFRPELVNPTDYAVIIREADVAKSMDILSAIPPEQRCRMRQKALTMYELYFKTGEGVIRGIVESLDLIATMQSRTNATTTVTTTTTTAVNPAAAGRFQEGNTGAVS